MSQTIFFIATYYIWGIHVSDLSKSEDNSSKFERLEWLFSVYQKDGVFVEGEGGEGTLTPISFRLKQFMLGIPFK